MTHSTSRPFCLVALASGALALALAAAGQEAPETHPTPPAFEAPKDRVVAQVNGEVILVEDVERQLARLHSEAAQGPREAPDLDRLIFRLVNDVLLAQEARAMEMHLEDPLPERLAKRRRELAVARLEREEISGPAEPTDEEVRRHFREEYRRVTLRVATAYERHEAEALLAQLETGADFEALARERSVDPFGPRGGGLEEIARYDLDRDVAAATFDLEPGALAGPIRTDLGWTVVRVEAVAPADSDRFDGEEAQIRGVVRFHKSQELRRALAEELRMRHPVVVNAQVLAAITPRRLSDGRLIPQVPEPAAVVARVGERTLTAEAYGRALSRRWTGVRNEEAATAAAPMVLERLLAEELLTTEALSRGYGEDPGVEKHLRAYERELLVPRFLELVVAAGIEVTEEEKETFYREQEERFAKPPRLHLAQITVADLESAQRLAAMARDGAEIAWLARRHSIDGFRDAGGDRGWVSAQPGLDSFNDQLMEARAGDVLGPFGEPGRYRVVKVTAVRDQGIYSLQEVSGNVMQELYRQKLSQVLDQYLERLRDRSKIDVDHELLARLGVTGSREEDGASSGGELPAGHGHAPPSSR